MSDKSNSSHSIVLVPDKNQRLSLTKKVCFSIRVRITLSFFLIYLAIQQVPLRAENLALSESELANYPQRQTSYGSLIGIERKQIEQKLGAPDKVEKQGDGQKEVWTYGRSMVFFVDGRVTAWSDLGEIKERENLSRIKEQRPNDTDLVNEEWINPWTPSKQHLSVIDVLMEIVDR